MMTLKEALEKGYAFLKQSSETPYLDAQILLIHVVGCEKAYLYGHGEEEMTQEWVDEYLSLIERRGKHCPVQYLTHSQEFMGLDFYVDERTLIPRGDTETLIDAVLKIAEGAERILDIGTGSGAIAITLSRFLPQASVYAVDISEEALEVARMNNARLNTEVTFFRGYLMDPVDDLIFDIIVSNPPYIKSDDYQNLMKGVKDYEPKMALVAEREGLFFYEQITQSATRYLSKYGYLAFEIGYDQGEAVKGIMASQGYKKLKVIQDLAGKDRVVIGMRGE
jgi:release factor glutamine methyltransferase